MTNINIKHKKCLFLVWIFSHTTGQHMSKLHIFVLRSTTFIHHATQWRCHTHSTFATFCVIGKLSSFWMTNKWMNKPTSDVILTKRIKTIRAYWSKFRTSYQSIWEFHMVSPQTVFTCRDNIVIYIILSLIVSSESSPRKRFLINNKSLWTVPVIDGFWVTQRGTQPLFEQPFAEWRTALIESLYECAL